MGFDSILNVEVSCYKDYYTPDNPKPVNLLSWLQSDKYANETKLIRCISNKAERDLLKAGLPCITPGGLFTHRKTDGLQKFSGLMQIDIDLKENKHIRNFDDLKSFISVLPYVAYCGLSVSGAGFWLLVPIKDAKAYQNHFKALSKDWNDIAGIAIDPARKDIAGLRGYSYDAGAYFNHSAQYYVKSFAETKPLRKPAVQFIGTTSDVFQYALQRTSEKGLIFAEGSRHRFIFEFCCILNTYGIDQYKAEAWIDKNLIPLTQIRSNCINDTYKRYSADFGKADFGKWVTCYESSTTKPYRLRPSSTGANIPVIPPRIVFNQSEPLPILSKLDTSATAHLEDYLSELENYFNGIKLPDCHIRLNQFTTIINVPLFVKNHLAIANANNGKRTFLSYIDRLQELKQVLSANLI